MPVRKVLFRPGFQKETTDYANEGGWRSGDKVRFSHSGLPERIGGWQKISQNSYLGSARALLPWYDLNGTSRTGVGTHIKYYVEEGGQYHDITPIRATTAAGDATFSATNGSSTITVTENSHGADMGDYVTFSGAATLGGVITAGVLNQEYKIETVPDANSYTITARAAGTSIQDITVDGDLSYTPLEANASDTGNGGASTVAAYQIQVAADHTALGSGFGTGTFSRGTFGSSFATTGTTGQLVAWSHDNFGEDLLMCRRGGPIFVWDTSVGTSTRATDISDAAGTDIPTVANRVMVSNRDRHVVALGVNQIGSADLDPMLIRWSDQEDYTDWSISATTTGGSLRASAGSEIITGIETRQQTLVFTDKALYGMQYLGPPNTFGLNVISFNTSIIGPNAGVAVDDIVYWMGEKSFYMYSGAVEEVECSVLDFVFGALDDQDVYKVTCGSLVEHSEIWWFFPGNDGTNRYAVYNYKQDIWYTGTLARDSWIDRANGPVPLAAGNDGYLYYHETGLDDGSQDPAVAIEAYTVSSPVGLNVFLGDGEVGDHFLFMSRILPDVTFDGSTAANPAVTFTVEASDYPGASYDQTDDGSTTRTATSPVEQFTEQLDIRLRGRQMTFKISSDETGVFWKWGVPRADVRPDGRR